MNTVIFKKYTKILLLLMFFYLNIHFTFSPIGLSVRQVQAQNWNNGLALIDSVLGVSNYAAGVYINDGNGDWSYCSDCYAQVNLEEIVVYGKKPNSTPIDLNISDIWHSDYENNTQNWAYWNTETSTWVSQNSSSLTQSQQTANTIINSFSSITLATIHSSRVTDNASPYQNIMDVYNGLLANRSSYGNAPGGQTSLSMDLLRGIVALSNNYNFTISEIAGGSHSVSSSHYAGVAIDINIVNGDFVFDLTESTINDFRDAACAAGATTIYDPYHDPYGGHENHIHVQW